MKLEDRQKKTTAPTSSSCPVTGLGVEFNPFKPPYLTDPYPFLARARREEPVFFSPELDYWVVTCYDDIKAIFQDPGTYSAANTQSPIKPLPAEAIQKLMEGNYRAKPVMSNLDPPEHGRIRRYTSQAFGAKRIRQLESDVRDLVTFFIDRLAPKGRADLVREMFYDLPALVIFKFLGIPDRDVPLVKSWAENRLMLTWGKLSDEEQMQVVDGLLAYWQYCERHIEWLRENPQDNFICDLIQANSENPEAISVNEIANIVFGLLIAGHETTTNSSANALVTLLQHRRTWEALCADPTLIPNAVEEVLRFATSVIAWRRKTTCPTVIGGVAVPEGANLLLMLGSANQDEVHFPDGAGFNIYRANAKDHLSFGHGIHYCIGAPLARLELRIILEELTRHLPSMRLLEGQPFEYLPNTSFRGPRHVWVEW